MKANLNSMDFVVVEKKSLEKGRVRLLHVLRT